MKSVHEVCELTGVTRKTLFYYDRIGLLKPTRREGAQKAKLYSDKAVEQLRQILAYQAAGLRLAEIREMLDCGAGRRRQILAEALDRLREEKRTAETKIDALVRLIRENENH